MKRLHIHALTATLITSLFMLAGCGQQQATEGFVPLFNGKDLTGWTVKYNPKDPGPSFWKVADGAIVVDSTANEGHDYVWLQSNDEYSDFILRLKFQAFRDNKGNSGVQIRSRYDDEALWLDGPQFDINPPGPWRTGLCWDETRGAGWWLYPEVPKDGWVDESMANPDMKFYFSDDTPSWNEMEITAVGTKLKCTLNGVVLSDFDAAGKLDDQTHKERNVGMKGHIALQIHRGSKLHMRFKDIELKNLPHKQ